MRKLLAFLLIGILYFGGTPEVFAADSTWQEGDQGLLSYICADEATMINLVNADLKSDKAVQAAAEKYTEEGICFQPPPFIVFSLIKRIFSYTDREQTVYEVWEVGTFHTEETFYSLFRQDWGPHKIEGEDA
tara:strand:- start:343 stop:738 length:396 start_codon:yes stop_codon:yes gene_type:complete